MLVAAQKSPVKRKVKMEYNKKEGGIYKLSTEDKTEIKEVFDLFLKQDSDYPDSISVFDMKIGLRGLGFNLMDGEAFAIMKDYDRDKTGFIQFGDFLEICAKKAATKNHVEDIDHAFKIFDFDNTGKISLRNLKRIVKDLGEYASDQELVAMINEFDKDKDGQISESEFFAIMKMGSIS